MFAQKSTVATLIDCVRLEQEVRSVRWWQSAGADQNSLPNLLSNFPYNPCNLQYLIEINQQNNFIQDF